MKIAIDVTRAAIESAGIGRYTREIVKNLIKIDQKNQYILIFTHFYDDSEKKRIVDSFQAPNVQIKHLRIPGGLKEKIWGWKLPWFEKFLDKADVFFAPSFFEVNLSIKIPQIVTIHDMATFLFPEQRGEEVSRRHNRRVKEVCQKAQKIITVSENTKKDLTEILKLDSTKIQTVYPGKTEFNKLAKNLPAGIVAKNYILTVGTVEPRKNLLRLVRGHQKLDQALRKKYPLVIVGAKGWNTKEEFKSFEKDKNIRWLGFVRDDELALVYKQAALFVYPSLYEGFGLPVAEAMQFGIPVITSNISSMPEVAGQAGVLVDPYDVKSITDQLKEVLTDKKRAKDLAKKSLVQAQKFSWEKAAEKTLNILKKVNHEK